MADHDVEMVSTLRGLLVVERETAKELIDGEGGNGDLYVAGRVGAYDFAIRAIDDRWPDLPNKFDQLRL